ncbi:MAG: hypothetical protein PT118_06370, partial [Aphanizomenon gracile PMC644.10]|nr:hypothetical protein [Aphanizomenon gracile PMC644.10]
EEGRGKREEGRERGKREEREGRGKKELFQLPITNYQSPITNYLLPVKNYALFSFESGEGDNSRSIFRREFI